MKKERIILTKDQIDYFHHEGFLSTDKLTDQEDIAFLLQTYDRIFSEQAGRESGDQFDLAGTDEDGETAFLPQILDPSKYAPEINQSQLLINTTSIAKQLLGKEAICSFAHAILKPAKIGAETPWHQDAAYLDPNLVYRAISIWVPLQGVTEENGCMQFVPGSHKKDVLSHQSINNDPHIHGLELIPEEMKNVHDVNSCPLPACGTTIHDFYMLHHTPPNRSNIPRRALILNATIPASTRSKPRKFHWMDEKKTAREKRAKDAAEVGAELN